MLDIYGCTPFWSHNSLLLEQFCVIMRNSCGHPAFIRRLTRPHCGNCASVRLSDSVLIGSCMWLICSTLRKYSTCRKEKNKRVAVGPDQSTDRSSVLPSFKQQTTFFKVQQVPKPNRSMCQDRNVKNCNHTTWRSKAKPCSPFQFTWITCHFSPPSLSPQSYLWVTALEAKRRRK